MKIEQETSLGKVNIEIPINLGDIILKNTTKYIITRIILVGDDVFLVNSYSGLWVNIKDVELSYEDHGIKYLKEKPIK